MNARERLTRLDPPEIETDRQLLERLGMNDAQAAMYLGKSRQALNNGLGSKRSGTAPNDYFKLSEILVLVIAAKQSGHPFEEARIRTYIEATRKPAKIDVRSPYSLLMNLLGSAGAMQLDAAAAVVLILPDFENLRCEHPEAAAHLRTIVSQVATSDADPWVVVLSSSALRASMAAQWLELRGNRVHALCHDFVDHYVPLVLIYDEGEENPRPFMLTDQGSLVAAPQYRAPTMAMCVASMLPDPVANDLFPSGKPGSADPKSPKPRKPAEDPERRRRRG